MDFKDRTVVITGAAGNLGRVLAQAMQRRGANLVLLDVQQAALDKAFDGKDARLMPAAVNLLDQSQLQGVISAAIARFGRLDAVCNIAGGFRMGEAVHETSDANWNFLFDLNARTVLHMGRAIVPHMLAAGGGKIVNIGAFAAHKGSAQMGAYIASKATVIRLTESMAAELRARNINVNCVLPTIIDTPENRKAMPDATFTDWVAPQDLASVIMFLASDDARAIHGAAIPVTGLS